MITPTSQLDLARAHWGADLPDWVEALALACARTSQAAVARQLDRTGAVVSQVLRNSYPASTARIEERIRGVLMAGTVDCPALGNLATDKCQDWREKAREFVLASPLRSRMYRACLKCPRNQSQKDVEE